MCLQCSHLVYIASAYSKLVRPIVKYWREQGLRITVFLDDGLCAMKGEGNVLEASTLVQSTLNWAGFVAHVTTSIWKPTQCLQWLGFVVDLSKGQIIVPEVWILLEITPETKDELEFWQIFLAEYIVYVHVRVISMYISRGPPFREISYTSLEIPLKF